MIAYLLTVCRNDIYGDEDDTDSEDSEGEKNEGQGQETVERVINDEPKPMAYITQLLGSYMC